MALGYPGFIHSVNSLDVMFSNRFFRFFQHLNLKTLQRLLQGIGQRRLMGLSAEMAYNNLLALFPMLVAILATIGMLDIPQAQIDSLARQFLHLAPEEVASLFATFTDQIQVPQGRTVVALSVFAGVWIASGALNVAMNAMDQICETPPERRRPFWKAKLIAIGLTIATLGLVLMASFLMFISDLILRLVLSYLEIPGTEILRLWHWVRWVSSLAILALAFSLIYRFGPSRWLRGNPILPGALIAAILWAIISQGFRIYVSTFGNFSVTYGALGAGIVLLLWLNLSSLTLLIGAYLNVTVGRELNPLRGG